MFAQKWMKERRRAVRRIPRIIAREYAAPAVRGGAGEEASPPKCMREIWLCFEESTRDTLTFNGVCDSSLRVELSLIETLSKVVPFRGVRLLNRHFDDRPIRCVQLGPRLGVLLILREGLTGRSWSRDLNHGSLAMQEPLTSLRPSRSFEIVLGSFLQNILPISILDPWDSDPHQI